jgi:cellulose synthase/poly-beta-1,6-N-acetylglucosamine synthase-like glycosyltransferase
LPGAYSAYRWDVLRKRQPGLQIPKNNTNYVKSIIDEEYLVSVLDPDFKSRPEYNIKKANMYLAEDRILCLEIFTKANYILKYIPDSECYTDSVKYFL